MSDDDPDDNDGSIGANCMRVHIVTDSTACLPTDLATRYNISVVPLHVAFGTDEYTDGIDMSPTQFHQMLETRAEHPVTSQPSPAEFADVYSRVGGDGRPIVSIHLCADLSGTLTSARMAIEQYPDLNIHLTTDAAPPVGIGLLALEAARASSNGAKAEDVVRLVNELASRTYVAFMVPTLEYLRKGGRIGGAQAFLGSLLSFKPILHFENRRVEPVTRVRSVAKSRRALMKYLRERAPNGVQSVSVLHAQGEESRAELEADVRAEFEPTGDFLADVELGPVLATHSGRGALGLAFIANP